MTCTAIIRYFCVVKPSLHQTYVKSKTVASGISLLWLIYSILLPFLLNFGRGDYSKGRTFCIYFVGNKYASILNYNNSALIVAFSSLIFLAHFKVFRFVSHHNRAVAANQEQQGNHSPMEVAKITKTVNKLTSVFYASVLFLMINFDITLSNFDNVMTKFIINKRTDA